MPRRVLQHDLWDKDEDHILRTHFGDQHSLRLLLPRRTQVAQRMRAAKLGLVSNYRFWTNREIAVVKKMRPSHRIKDISKALVDRSEYAVSAKCHMLGLRKLRQRPVVTGDQLLDMVRARAHELKFTMYELDEIAQCRPYFQRECRFIPRNNSAILKAILVLGGSFYWTD